MFGLKTHQHELDMGWREGIYIEREAVYTRDSI